MEVVNYPGIPGTFLAVLFSGALRWVQNNYAAVTCNFHLDPQGKTTVALNT